ncbi:PLP-dependent cysteine synthase family protein [Actinophytocola sp.]|uniref:PLP-dependent cysteine synthase family protein n=1 Tax=Actinophytocola sp. TaxID=1872138 RepID=UPI00389A2A0A
MTAVADVVEAHRIPVLLRLTPNLYALAYRLMKMVPARHILREARRAGTLTAGTTVVETTSGTFGLALAMQCALDAQPLVLVGDPVIDARLHRQLTDLGARVDIVREPAARGGFQAPRLARVAEIRAGIPDTFCPEQYTNPANPDSYSLIADLLVDRLGQVDCLVGPVGSGGSMCGTTRYLREAGPGMVSIGVDANHSVLFGQDDGPRTLRGLGNSLLPANLDHTQFDEVHWLGAPEAYAATRALHRGHALFMGPTSGAAFLVGSWWARWHPDALTVVVLPDEGHRYHDTVYDDAWLAANGMVGPTRAAPREVATPGEGTDGWCRFAWRRRTLAEARDGALAEVVGS